MRITLNETEVREAILLYLRENHELDMQDDIALEFFDEKNMDPVAKPCVRLEFSTPNFSAGPYR